MARVCQITGKKPMVGNNVSHSNRKTGRRFLPNLKHHRLWVAAEKRFIKLRVSSHGLRIIEKKGISEIISRLRDRDEKI
jgi:large subunit ribosomal protein L28